MYTIKNIIYDIPLIIKTDVQGSAEAIRDSLVKLNNDIAKLNIKIILIN